MTRPRLIRFVHREGLTSVVRSQVVQPLQRLQCQFDCRLVFTLPVGHWLRPALVRSNREHFGELTKATGIPSLRVPVAPAGNEWWPERKILRRIFRRLGGEGQFIIQARNASGAALALQATADIRQARVVYDVRGAEPEELAQRLGEDCPADLDLRSSSHLLRQAYINEQIAFRGAAGCVFVSGALRDHLTSRYGAIQIPVSIQPCATDVGHFQKASVERELVRRELGLSDRFVFCYVGSLEWYQKPELGLKWFEAIRKSVRDCHFLAITTQPERFRQMGLALGVPTERLTCLRTGASGVARLTSAADIGLMLRDETIVNRVASPVKFAEYMASGLPVLITPGLGDYSYAVASRQLGIVVTGTPDCDKEIALCVDRIREIRAQRDQFSKRCCEFATTHLSWENSISSHSDFLQHVLESTR